MVSNQAIFLGPEAGVGCLHSTGAAELNAQLLCITAPAQPIWNVHPPALHVPLSTQTHFQAKKYFLKSSIKKEILPLVFI